MKSTLFIAALCATMLTACATDPNQTPEQAAASRLERIQTACEVDAGVRPIIDSLLVQYDITMVTQPEMISALEVARAVIDPICANPSGDNMTNAGTAFYGATGKVIAIYTQLVNRQLEEGKAVK